MAQDSATGQLTPHSTSACARIGLRADGLRIWRHSLHSHILHMHMCMHTATITVTIHDMYAALDGAGRIAALARCLPAPFPRLEQGPTAGVAVPAAVDSSKGIPTFANCNMTQGIKHGMSYLCRRAPYAHACWKCSISYDVHMLACNFRRTEPIACHNNCYRQDGHTVIAG